MPYYFRQFFVLYFSKVTYSFLIKKSRQKAIEIETVFFHSLGNPKGGTLDDLFYALCIRENWYLYRWVSWPISEVINENSTSAFIYWDDFRSVLLSGTKRVHLWKWSGLEQRRSRVVPWACKPNTIDDSAKGGLIQFWELFTMIPCVPKYLKH